MIGIGAGSLLAFLLALPNAGGDGPAPTLEPGEFRGWFDDARAGTLRIPAGVEAEARRFRYVFVAGFRNEGMRGYFAQNVKELRAQGVPREAIHVIAPSSDRTIAGNAPEVNARFRAIAAQGPEPLVVIAHSRGACDALAFALANPRFVRDRVRALFLVQGAFGGTAVADYVAGDGPGLDRRIPLRHRALAGLAGRVETRRLKRGEHGGLAELTRSAAREFWERTLEEHADAVPIVGPRTFYVTSRTTPARLRSVLRSTAWYLSTAVSGPNDGMVALEDQSLPELGTVLAVLDAGHADLTGRAPTTRAPQQVRRALIQGIVMAVGQPEANRTDTDRPPASDVANSNPNANPNTDRDLRRASANRSARTRSR